jgi:hypothetical protein
MSRKRGAAQSNIISAVIGGALLLFCFVWLGWIFLNRYSSPLTLSLPNFASTSTQDTSTAQIVPLLAEGITLGNPTRQPTLNQQQALLIANQLEPDAATQAKSVTASYILLNYANTSTSATHASLNNVAAWMIWYQRIPYVPADASVDPTPFPHAFHDLYVFIDANSGKELLVVWV